MIMEIIPILTLLVGIIMGMGICLLIVRWAFEYERKLIIEFMDRDEAKGAIQTILVPKEKEKDFDANNVMALYNNKEEAAE